VPNSTIEATENAEVATLAAHAMKALVFRGPNQIALACIIHEGAASGRCEREIVAKLHSWLRNVGYLARAGACLAAPWVRRRFSSAAFPDTQLA
jgi:hypothetical protein